MYALIIFLLMLTVIIYYKPSALLCIPLIVSVIVMLLQSRVNRYAFALGASNSILYAIAYAKMTLYSTATYSFLVSFPLQLITFFNWSRHTEKKRTELKKMSLAKKMITAIGILSGFILLYIIFSCLNSQYLFFDNCITILGVIATILCMLRYQEYAILQILSNLISLITFFLMVKEDLSKIIWIINASNAIICSFLTLKNIKSEVKL